ncbi:MAG: hypothetical protein ACI9S8_001463 [Chlamydiales bacterium]|jgi:hypothetical protein
MTFDPSDLHLFQTDFDNANEKALETISSWISDLDDLSQFNQWLKDEKPIPNRNSLKNISNIPIFRIVGKNREPFELTGNFAFGSRFCIGASQLTFLPNIEVGVCLYASQTIECARTEFYGDSIKRDGKEYELIPKRKNIELWSIEELIEKNFHYPNLIQLINEFPTGAAWGLQKIPKISQRLAHYIRNFGGDGILYKSVNMNHGDNTCYAFFVDGEHHARDIFEAQLDNKL